MSRFKCVLVSRTKRINRNFDVFVNQKDQLECEAGLKESCDAFLKAILLIVASARMRCTSEGRLQAASPFLKSVEDSSIRRTWNELVYPDRSIDFRWSVRPKIIPHSGTLLIRFWINPPFFSIPRKLEVSQRKARHLMPSSRHREPPKDSSGLWKRPAVLRVQRFNKFQGSSQGRVTLWATTQNQKNSKYARIGFTDLEKLVTKTNFEAGSHQKMFDLTSVPWKNGC